MSTTVASSQGPALSEEGAVKRFLRATEIDTRMLGMVGAAADHLGWASISTAASRSTRLIGGSF